MMAEKIRLVLAKRNMNKAQLAEKLGCSATNLYQKLKRDNFSEHEFVEMANALNCRVEIHLILNDTDEKF